MRQQAPKAPTDFVPDLCLISSSLEFRDRKKKGNGSVPVSQARKANESADRQPIALLVGRYRELALYRAEVLRQMGFEVKVTTTPEEARDAINDGGFEVAILSYTMSSDVVKELADLIRQKCPECPLLTISQNAKQDPHVMPDAVVMSELGPAGLIRALKNLMSKKPH